jgi:hypothetical protein
MADAAGLEPNRGSRMSHPDATSMPPRVAAVLAQVAVALEGQADQIAGTMLEAYKMEIPSYAGICDDALLDDVKAVSSALVRCWLTVMASGTPVQANLVVPLLEGARRRAAQGFDLQSLLRAYRIGIRVMWSEITASSVWRGRPLQGVLAQVGTWVLGFADQICTGVAAAYMDEAAKVAREREHRRSALLNLILAGPGSESVDGPQELHSLHCIVVASVAPDLSLSQLEQAAENLEQQIQALLWTVRHRSVVAAVGISTPAYRSQLRNRLGRLLNEGRTLAFGIGGRAEGLGETRQSYAEAVDALRVGPHLGTGAGAVYDYHDFAPIASLMSDPGRARRFAKDTLEPLGDLVRRDWVLPTIESYLVHQGRLKEIAADLSVHQSTVKYRINELRPHVEESLRDGDAAARMLLAVRLRHLLAADGSAPEPRSEQAQAAADPSVVRALEPGRPLVARRRPSQAAK